MGVKGRFGPNGAARWKGQRCSRPGEGTEERLEITMSTPAATPPQPTRPTTGALLRPAASRPVSGGRGRYHAMFRTGVKAEIGRAVAVVGEAADGIGSSGHSGDPAGRGTARRPPARRRWRRGLAEGARDQSGPEVLALSVSDAAEDVIGVIRAGALATSPSRHGTKLIDTIRRVADGDTVFWPRWQASCWMPSPAA